MPRKRNFSSKAAYQKWLAYGHMRTKSGEPVSRRKRSMFASTPGHQKISIQGKAHEVKHRRKRTAC